MRLDTTNFFRYFIFNPGSKELDRCDTRIAKVATVALAIATLGICHAVCYFFFYDRRYTVGATSTTAKKTVHTASDVVPIKQRAAATTEVTTSVKPKSVPNDYLLDFYRGTGTDIEGRSLEKILAFSLDKKESAHDYIQWLFPIDASSQFNMRAPVLNHVLIAEMKKDPQVINNMKRSFHSMLEFYGLGYDEKKHEVYKLDSFETRAKVWLTSGNHNFLRITRILHSLNLMGLHDEAAAFYKCLNSIQTTHSACRGSVSHWKSAAQV